MRRGCWRLVSAAVTRGPHHRGLPVAPASQFSFLSPFSLSPSNSLEQLCSVRKKHFSFLRSVLSQLPRSGRGVCPSPESGSRTSRSAASRFPETRALGATLALSSGLRLRRGGRLGPSPECSPLGTETHPESGFSVSVSRPFCFCKPRELGIQGFCGIQPSTVCRVPQIPGP